LQTAGQPLAAEKGAKMPARNPDLHGMVPDKAPVVLLLLDVINDLEFDGGADLLRHALPMAERVAALKQRARAAKIPTIYVNDNYGRWRSDFHELVKHVVEDDTRGRPVTERLMPEEDDYFVLKPKHSGFYSTTLDVLLSYLSAQTLILTGMAGNICVLFTANDAYMRDYNLVVPADCSASEDPERNHQALALMERVLKADIRPSTEIDIAALRQAVSAHGNRQT
jgi:nicotinamidase-related amidase